MISEAVKAFSAQIFPAVSEVQLSILNDIDIAGNYVTRSGKDNLAAVTEENCWFVRIIDVKARLLLFSRIGEKKW